ncbi:MAG: acyl-CoA dehydrogenase family protein, partial [Halioglobus sp.]|nr:acyl-CoA dehydrogenase family protein [Halioglobus sp.]
MTQVSPETGLSLDSAGTLLAAAQTLLAQGAAHIRQNSLIDGAVSPGKLDAQQLVSYELAVSWSECTAARFLLNHAARLQASNPDPFVERLAMLFCAEVVTESLQRLRLRPAAYGLTLQSINTLVEEAPAALFLETQLAPENIEALGWEILERNGDLGPDLLGEHHSMMRDTFRRFADDVVAPLAEEVHRQDLDIPDEILEPLKEMGLFGLSIPESYGGLQADDKEDTLGMIVVTEELSRGSLGAAGSLITRPEILSRALLKAGTEKQKQQWLGQLAVGDPLCAVAVTEPNYGSDVAGVRLRATQVDGGWMLNGAKTWCTFAGKA